MDSMIHVHNLRFHNPNLFLAQPISSPCGTTHRLTYQSSRPPQARSYILGDLPRARCRDSFSCGVYDLPYSKHKTFQTKPTVIGLEPGTAEGFCVLHSSGS